MPKTDSSFSVNTSNHPLAEKLVNWYAQCKRALPWRDNPLPYMVWVAEIMAQQTRLETMLPFFDRWMKKYPDLRSLSEGKIQDVLKLWEGLGYYQRARNLHKAARMIMNDYGGKIPDRIDLLRKLPGIGPYTAGAIASIAFGKNEAAVDGNAARVLARLFNISLPINEAKGLKQAWRYAQEIMPIGQASDFNQSLMDLGAFICLPRAPKCDQCPLILDCNAKQLDIQDNLPVRKKFGEIPTRYYVSGVLTRKERILLRQRSQDGLLGGLWEFPNSEIDAVKKADSALPELFTDLQVKGKLGHQLNEIQHRYSHFQARVIVFELILDSGQGQLAIKNNYRWFTKKELPDFPMGKIDRQIANQILSDVG